jgi:two-component system sensor histidine kinase MprB
VGGDPWRVSIQRGPAQSRLVIAESMAAAERASTSATQAIVLAMVAGIVIAAFAGALAAVAATGRIDQLLARIRAASIDVTGATRVGRVGGRDLDAVAIAFDSLLDDLRHADESQRRLFADAAHELRTPLTSMRTNAQLLERDRSLYDEARDIASRIARQSEGVARLVSQLVDHASVRAWSGAAPDAVELAVIAASAIERAQDRWPDVEIRLSADRSVLAVDPQLVERAVGNLIDNAVTHGSGTVRVLVSGGVIAVEDDGPGFAHDLGDEAFRPFVSSSRDGASSSGLGLAFVDHVARAHGGSVSVTSSNPTRVELVLGDEPS